jgi:hypothetical protein
MRKPDWLIDGLMCDEGWVGRRLTGGSTGFVLCFIGELK